LIEDHHKFINDPKKLLMLACKEQKDLKIMNPNEVY